MKLCPRCQKQFSDDANFCPVDAARLVALETQAVAADSLAARFALAGRLGGGRTGAVHRATDQSTGQPAAVKIIAPAVVALPGLAQRLERELKQLERVRSGGVTRVLASGRRGDDSWVALELLDGAQTLAEAVAARGPMPVDQAARLIEVVGEALIEAAQVGVVHRDLAPKNILFAGDGVKLINFSLPVPTGDKVPGVAEFVAPEQHDGKPVDQRSNLYSLGALYYFVLTARTVRVQADGAGAVAPPSSLAEVPGPVEALILRALDRSPTKRFLTVRQFIDEVGRVARGGTDTRSMQPLRRPRAELVDTQPDGPSAGATILGVGAVASQPPSGSARSEAPLGGPQGAASDRSPWAQPAAPAAPSQTAQATTVPVAGPEPGPALPGATQTGDGAMGKFRETLWFKKGEADPGEPARTGTATSDTSGLPPLDERYDDDGSLSRSDKDRYSLRTGATLATSAVPGAGSRAGAGDGVSDDELIGEMKGGRAKIIAMIAVGLVVIAAIVLLIAR